MTVSEAEVPAGPHSAADPAAASPEGGQRARRARAREDTPGSAQSDTPVAAQFTAQFTGTLGDRITTWRAAVVAEFTPPDIVTTDRPSLRKAWAYASRGEWTSATGAPRRAGQVYGCFAIAVKTVLYYLDWIIERPSRHAAAWVLVILFAQFPPLSWLF